MSDLVKLALERNRAIAAALGQDDRVARYDARLAKSKPKKTAANKAAPKKAAAKTEPDEAPDGAPKTEETD